MPHTHTPITTAAHVNIEFHNTGKREEIVHLANDLVNTLMRHDENVVSASLYIDRPNAVRLPCEYDLRLKIQSKHFGQLIAGSKGASLTQAVRKVFDRATCEMNVRRNKELRRRKEG